MITDGLLVYNDDTKTLVTMLSQCHHKVKLYRNVMFRYYHLLFNQEVMVKGFLSSFEERSRYNFYTFTPLISISVYIVTVEGKTL